MTMWLVLAALQAVTLFDSVRDAPLAPGAWTYAPTSTGSEARFGAIFRVQCDRATRRVNVSRTEAVRSSPAGPTNIFTDTRSGVLPADGWLGAYDPLLDALAYTRGRFVVTGGGGVRLVLAASPEAARSIEDCRN